MSISNLPTEETYTSLITSEHRNKPLFVATVALFVSGFIGNPTAVVPGGDTVADSVSMGVGPSLASQNSLSVFANLPMLADIDYAVGNQLDNLGQWIGLARTIYVNSTYGLVTLSDSDYQSLLYAKIASNNWDGGMQSFQTILSDLFKGSGIVMKAYDNQNMSLDIYLSGTPPTALQIALLKAGLVIPQPAGVLINGYIQPSGPVFGLDEEDSAIGGPDVGSFPTYI